MKRCLGILFALVLLLSLAVAAVPMAGTVEAATINVPADYPTIQKAVDNATAGDVINVAAGTYYESITLKDGVEVLGAGADVTTIDGSTARGGQPAYHVVLGADNATLDGFTVTGGNATGVGFEEYGGGIYNYDCSPTVTNCSFEGNSASVGGGMCNYYNSSPTVTDCSFSGNSANYHGGGMYNYDCSPTVTNCIFEGNSADYDGGGMCNYRNSSPTVTDCIFSGNSAGDDGGGMYNGYDSSPTVTNCSFSGNSAYYGGGMYNSDSSPAVTNCIFEGNSADYQGGGMYNRENSSPTVDSCIFSGNSAYYGGGMYNYLNSSPTVTKCIFLNNSANDYLGGGMYNYNYCSPTVTNCIFLNNSADFGGGMSNYDSSPTVTNCVFWGNSAYDGGGMYNYHNSSPAITNNIIVSNTASYGGGIWAGDASYPIIDYNDVWNNTGGDYYGCSAGPNDISQDPLFVHPAAGDYHFQPGPPCIDAGTNVGAPAEDIEGKPRPIDGDGDGTAITDMGAYEYMPPPPAHFRYLHAEGGLFNLTEPVGTQWHELWPIFCREYHLSSWNDTGGDGVLSRCDQIGMYEEPDGAVKRYHVEEVTITLNVTHNETGEPMYIELEGGYNASVLINPVGTQWHEIYPISCRQYELSSWNDTGSDGLAYCDLIELTDKWTQEKTWCHVEEVAIDIIVTIEPPPVGGEAYPVNKMSLLVPWIAVAAVLAGGISWLTLRRRRTQS